MTEEEFKRASKDALKEGLKEWLDEKFTQLGKWSAGIITAMLLAALVYFVLAMNGWQKSALPKL